MFFALPCRLRQAGVSRVAPEANVALIVVNVLFYLFGWCWVVGPGTSLLSVLLYAFCHANLWHLLVNMWVLWVFGNPVNRRIGNGYFLLAYLGSALVVGLFARLLLPSQLVGSSGAVFAVITLALVLMPAAVVEIACVALFPLSVVVGLLSRPRQWFQWLVRWAVYPVPALWALVLIPLMQLALLLWSGWCPTYWAHLLGMLCGLGVVVLLPSRITMGGRSVVGSY